MNIEIRDGSEFIVKLNGIDLPQKNQDRIAARIQRAVLDEVAEIDLGGQIAIHFPREWPGLLIDHLPLEGRVPNLRVEVGRG